jgi:hypothetical protein
VFPGHRIQHSVRSSKHRHLLRWIKRCDPQLRRIRWATVLRLRRVTSPAAPPSHVMQPHLSKMHRVWAFAGQGGATECAYPSTIVCMLDSEANMHVAISSETSSNNMLFAHACVCRNSIRDSCFIQKCMCLRCKAPHTHMAIRISRNHRPCKNPSGGLVNPRPVGVKIIPGVGQ